MQRRIFAGGWLVLLVAAVVLGGCAPKRLPPLEPGLGQPESSDGFAVPTLLDVGLAENEETLTLSVNGSAQLLDSQTRERLFRFDADGGEVRCTRSGDQVQWSVSGGVIDCQGLVLQPTDPAFRVSHGDQDYRGDFLVIVSPRSGGLTLINQVGLEDYLRGVVPWEIGRHGEEKKAALGAQAVAARTYTISHLGSRRSLGFDVYASVMDQVYKGSRHEDPLCNEAIEESAHLVLQYGDKLVDAYYSACCGGHSSQVERVWPRKAEAYLIHHPDSMDSGDKAFCSGSSHFQWEESWPAGRLEEILQNTLPAYVNYMSQMNRPAWARPMFSPAAAGVDPAQPGRLIDLEILDRTPSGRVAQLVITTEAGSYHIRGDRTRWVLAPASGRFSILRSAMFELELERSDGRLVEIRASGNGFGHGIGLCQTGALEMANQGYSAPEILSHYYPGSVLRRLGGK